MHWLLLPMNKSKVQHFRKSLELNQSYEEIKFVVQDLQTPDGQSVFG